jgi:hypothetical protein
MSSIAIVILNYNGRAHLEQFLPGVILNSPEADIVVADNQSTDSSLQYLAEKHPDVKIIELGDNHGFAKGYNLALSDLKYDFYLLLNSDVEVTKGWITPLLDTLQSDQSIAAVQPKILAHADKQTFEYAGAAGGYIDSLGYPFCRGRIFNNLEKDQGQYDTNTSIFWASGACLLVRSDVFHLLGGFDDEFFAHMEEIDLCWRMHHAGYKVMFEHSSIVYHVGGGTLPKSSPQKTYLNFRNGLTLIYKNLPGRELIWKLPVRLALDLIAALKFLVSDSPRHSWSVFRALGYFIFNPSRNRRRRRETIQKTGLLPSSDTFAGSIVFKFYLKGEQKFFDLPVNIPKED